MKGLIPANSGGVFARFTGLFLLCFGGLFLLFEYIPSLFSWGYMYPLAGTAVWLLDGIGIPVVFEGGAISQGYCLLRLDGVVLRVIHECTGLFTFFLLVAMIAAFPATFRHKGWGILGGLTAFFLYNTVRLVLLGIVGYHRPEWVVMVHHYLAVLLHLGFVLFIWLYWVQKGSYVEK